MGDARPGVHRTHHGDQLHHHDRQAGRDLSARSLHPRVHGLEPRRAGRELPGPAGRGRQVRRPHLRGHAVPGHVAGAPAGSRCARIQQRHPFPHVRPGSPGRALRTTQSSRARQPHIRGPRGVARSVGSRSRRPAADERAGRRRDTDRRNELRTSGVARELLPRLIEVHL